MKPLIAAAVLLCASAAHAQVQSNDIAFARNSDGVILALNMQPCVMSGFYWWHLETPAGKTTQTGCWTFATHRRVMLTDGKGGVQYLPDSRFSRNPSYGE